MSDIAIFSTSIDRPSFGPVAEILEKRGYDAWVYQSDKVVSAEDKLTISVNADNEFDLIYNGKKQILSDYSSAWYRHPEIYNLNLPDKAKQLSLEYEITSLQESFWQQVPEKAWFNHPARMKQAQAKLSQLVLAKELGFSVPSTVVSNTWEGVDMLTESKDCSDIIVKMPKGVLYESNNTKVLYATKLDEQKRQELSHTNPFPAFYQHYKQKAREWRITVIGEYTFPVAIYTTDKAKDDWRRHQLTSDVQFKAEELSDAIIEKCVRYLGKVGLLYGAFDFIEDNDGQLTFLECNTNGQYRWLEDLLALPISDVIATQLISIYNDNQ